MAACETCWTEASRRAFLRGGHVANHYREVLADADPADHEGFDVELDDA